MKIKKQKQKVKQESPYDFKLSPGCLGCLDALDAWMPYSEKWTSSLVVTWLAYLYMKNGVFRAIFIVQGMVDC